MDPKKTLKWLSIGFILLNIFLILLALQPEEEPVPAPPPLTPQTNLPTMK